MLGRQASELESLKRQLLLAATHELNTPLHEVMGCLDAIISAEGCDSLPEATLPLAQTAQSSIFRAARLVRTMMDAVQVRPPPSASCAVATDSNSHRHVWCTWEACRPVGQLWHACRWSGTSCRYAARAPACRTSCSTCKRCRGAGPAADPAACQGPPRMPARAACMWISPLRPATSSPTPTASFRCPTSSTRLLPRCARRPAVWPGQP